MDKVAVRSAPCKLFLSKWRMVLEPYLMKRLTLLLPVLAFVLSTTAAQASLQFDSDVQPALKAQILEDFSFIQSIKSIRATPLHQKIFGDVDGANYFEWFTKRVFSVGLNDCGSSSAVACVIVSVPNKIWMTPNYTKFSHPQIARLSVVYHEARHTESENGKWSHATCPTPFKDAKGNNMQSIWTGALLEGKPACDVTAFGSYGSATIFLKNIGLNCSNCSEKVMADANLYGNDQLGRIVDAASKKNMMLDFGLKIK